MDFKDLEQGNIAQKILESHYQNKIINKHFNK